MSEKLSYGLGWAVADIALNNRVATMTPEDLQIILNVVNGIVWGG